MIALGATEPLKSALTDLLETWGDLWTARLMRQIDDGAFIPDLIRVLRDTDGLSYIHEDAIRKKLQESTVTPLAPAEAARNIRNVAWKETVEHRLRQLSDRRSGDVIHADSDPLSG